jgi:hypothetical protein
MAEVVCAGDINPVHKNLKTETASSSETTVLIYEIIYFEKLYSPPNCIRKGVNRTEGVKLN